jgi:hypothetical protein
MLLDLGKIPVLLSKMRKKERSERGWRLQRHHVSTTPQKILSSSLEKVRLLWIYGSCRSCFNREGSNLISISIVAIPDQIPFGYGIAESLVFCPSLCKV